MPMPAPADAEQPLRLLVGAGLRLPVRAYCESLRDTMPLPEITFGVGQTLARRISEDGGTDLLLASDIEMVRAVARPASQVTAFGTDTLIAASRPELGLNQRDFLVRLMEDQVRLVVAGPGLSAGSEIAERFLALCESQMLGSSDALRDRLRPVSTPDGFSWGPRQAMEVLTSGEADVVLGPRSMLRSLSAVADLVRPPPEMAIHIACTMVVLASDPDRRAASQRFAAGLLSATGQAILARHGFGPASQRATVM